METLMIYIIGVIIAYLTLGFVNLKENDYSRDPTWLMYFSWCYAIPVILVYLISYLFSGIPKPENMIRYIINKFKNRKNGKN